MNLMQLISMIRNGGNPQQLVMNMLEQQMGSTPIGQNMLNLAKTGDTASLEQLARNLCQQRGLDFDKEFASFKKTLGL